MKEVDPKNTKRALAFESWMNVPMPMVTIFKTIDVANLMKSCRRRGYKFNMLMCWCIGKAASQMDGGPAAQFLECLQNDIKDLK